MLAVMYQSVFGLYFIKSNSFSTDHNFQLIYQDLDGISGSMVGEGALITFSFGV